MKILLLLSNLTLIQSEIQYVSCNRKFIKLRKVEIIILSLQLKIFFTPTLLFTLSTTFLNSEENTVYHL